jgi:hypothetical protein
MNVYDLNQRVAIVTAGLKVSVLRWPIVFWPPVAASPYGIATVRSLMRR